MIRVKKSIRIAATCLAASALVLVAAQPLTQDAAAPPSLVGKEHAWLAKDAGNWTAECVWYGPMGEQPFQGKETITVDCGGLWSFSSFEADLGGMPFKGRGVTGYDPGSGQYVGAWVDCMSTRILRMEGKREGEKLVMHTEGIDPETGETFPEKHVQRREGDDRRVFEMSALREKGEVLTMRIVYTRVR
jgi:hypothetical protein